MIFKPYKLSRVIFERNSCEIKLFFSQRNSQKYFEQIQKILEIFGLMDTYLVGYCEEFEDNSLLTINEDDVKVKTIDRKIGKLIIPTIEIVFNPKSTSFRRILESAVNDVICIEIRTLIDSSFEMFINLDGQDLVSFSNDDYDFKEIKNKLKNTLF